MTRLMKDDAPVGSHFGKSNPSNTKLTKPPPVNAPIVVPPTVPGGAGPDGTSVSK